MPTLVMPKLGLTMEEGRISAWMVAAGASFRAGEILVVVETDKIASEVEAASDGVLQEIVAQVDDVVPVGAPLAIWSSNGEVAPERPSANDAIFLAPDAARAANPPAKLETIRDAATTPKPQLRVVATPLARREARERNVDLTTVRGSGPHGRIKQADVIGAASEKKIETRDEASKLGSAGALPTTPLSSWQKVAAERMVLSKTSIPHFYVSTEIDAGPLEAAIAALRAAAPERRVTATHLMLLAVGRALIAMPEANRIWDGGAYRTLGSADVGLAIATPAGLAAPVLENCAASVWDISARAGELVARARQERLAAHDFDRPAAITLSNAGMYDITQMISIIPPGQTSILGVGSIRSIFRPDGEGRPVPRREIVAALSCDHRVLDGAAAIRFLNIIKDILHNPMTALLAPVPQS